MSNIVTSFFLRKLGNIKMSKANRALKFEVLQLNHFITNLTGELAQTGVSRIRGDSSEKRFKVL